MKSANFKVAVFGLGKIGVGYDINAKSNQVYTHAKAVMRHPKTSLCFGVDSNTSARKRFESVSNKTSYKSVALAAENESHIDIAIVAVPTCLHFKMTKEILLHFPNVKMILVEKPMASSLSDAKKIVELCQKKNVKLATNYYLPHLPAIKALNKKIVQGKWGRLKAGHVFYSRGVRNNASHFLHLLVTFFWQTHRHQSR